MEIDFDPTINVGIKYSQKIEIIKIIKYNYKFKSVNHFVQDAIREKLLKSHRDKAK